MYLYVSLSQSITQENLNEIYCQDILCLVFNNNTPTLYYTRVVVVVVVIESTGPPPLLGLG